MNWLLSLIFDTSSFAHGFLVYSVIISLGICLGRKKNLRAFIGRNLCFVCRFDRGLCRCQSGPGNDGIL